MRSKTRFFLLLFVATTIQVATSLNTCSHEPDALCFDPTCAQPLTDLATLDACECNDDNIGQTFLDCDPKTNTRRLLYYWRPPATCLGGTLPPPVDIPCDLTCPKGSYLDVDNSTCQECPLGTFGVGDGHMWDTWNEWPAQFTSSCVDLTNKTNCSAWRLLGESIDSGNNLNMHNLRSTVQLRVRLVKSGQVTFTYRVDAEKGFDGLTFAVDSIPVFFISQAAWTSFSYNLTAGYHSLEWSYVKDKTLTRGSDRAYISDISVSGLVYATTRCEECPIGHFQNMTGQSVCQDCPAGTYNDDVVGASVCKPCPDWGYSYPGATKCIPRRICDTEYDYTYYFTPCISTVGGSFGNHIKKHVWIEPLSCDNTNVSLPLDVIESCDVSPPLPGTVKTANGGYEYCSSGNATFKGKCTMCPAGMPGTPRVRYFNDWSNVTTISGTGSWTRSCSGPCFSEDGWRYGYRFMDSGLGHGQNAISNMELSVVLYEESVVNFTYSVVCQSDSEFTFAVDGFVVKSFECGGCNTNNTKTVSFPLYWGDDWEGDTHLYTFTWSYHRGSDPTQLGCDRAMLWSVNISGIAVGIGGAASCESCPAGTFAATAGLDVCHPCSQGYYSNGTGNSECLQCGNGTVAADPASGACFACGANTKANVYGTDCAYQCDQIEFSDGDRVYQYDLSDIGYSWNMTFNGTSYRGNLCSRPELCREGTHICSYDDEGRYHDNGRVTDISELAGHSGIKMSYLLGSSVGTSRCTSNVLLRCDPVVATDAPTLLDTKELHDSCIATFVWPTIYACPLCSENDYSYTESSCDNGRKTITYFWTNSQCMRGVKLPDTTAVSCSSEVSFYWRTVVIVCVFGAVTVGAAVFGLVLLHYRNKKLFVAYESLKNSNIPLDEHISTSDEHFEAFHEKSTSDENN